MKSKFIFIAVCVLLLLNTSCKHDVAGCNDPEALNRKMDANLNDGSCVYAPFFIDPSFEEGNDAWATYAGTNFSPFAYVTNKGDGFMPTDGKCFLKCLPTVNYWEGTWTTEHVIAIKHYKGFYFDYSCVAIARPQDSLLNAKVSFIYEYGINSPPLWTKYISATPASFSGFPSIKIQKKKRVC